MLRLFPLSDGYGVYAGIFATAGVPSPIAGPDAGRAQEDEQDRQ